MLTNFFVTSHRVLGPVAGPLDRPTARPSHISRTGSYCAKCEGRHYSPRCTKPSDFGSADKELSVACRAFHRPEVKRTSGSAGFSCERFCIV